MVNELKTQKINVPVCAFEVSSEEKIELEVNLPDYCSDIKRVLRCFAEAGINSIETAGDRLSVKGDIVLRLLYVGDDGKIDCLQHTVALSKHTDVKNMPENPIALCEIRPLYINSRAASQRRFTVSGNFLVNFKIYTLRSLDICTGAVDECIETKCEKITAVTQSVVGEKLFDMTETLSLSEDKKAVGRIICCDSRAENITYKAVSGKILLKGDMVTRVLYASDTKDKEFEAVTHRMPISQIVEIAGCEKEFTFDLRVCAVNTSVIAKADSTGENRLLDFVLKVSCFVEGTKSAEVCFVKDAFNKKYEGKFVFDDVELLHDEGVIDKKKSVSSSLDLSSLSPRKIIDVRILSKDCSTEVKDREVLLKINILFALIFTDEKGKIQYAERNADTVFSFETKEKCSKVYCKPNVFVQEPLCSVEGDSVNVKYDLSVSGNLYSVQCRKILKEAECDEKERTADSDGVLTVYYSSEGERVWDIAKRYLKSEKEIKEENNLDTDVIKADMMLII